MNDLVPAGDYSITTLIPIIIAMGVIVFGVILGFKFKKFGRGLFKKKNTPAQSMSSEPETVSETETETPAEAQENSDESTPTDETESPPEAPAEKTRPPESNVGGLLAGLQKMSRKRKPKKKDAPATPLFEKAAAASSKPAPGRNAAAAELIIGREDEDLHMIIEDGMMTPVSGTEVVPEQIKRKIYLNPDRTDILIHGKNIFRREAATAHNNLVGNICLHGKTSFSLNEPFVNSFPEKTEIIPFGALALYWVDKIFKKPKNRKMVIITFAELANPFIYTLTQHEDGKIVEELLTGANTKISRKQINDEEIYRLDVLFDRLTEKEHFDYNNSFKYPEVEQTAQIYLNQFIKDAKLKAISPPSDVEISKYLLGLAASGALYGVIFGVNFLLAEHKNNLAERIDELEAESQDYAQKIKKLGARRLPEYLKENQVNFKTMFEITDQVGKIELLELKDIIWDRNGDKDRFIITGKFSNNITDNYISDIQARLAAQTTCETNYVYDGGVNETSVTITCRM